MSPHIFDVGLRMNQNVYQNVLTKFCINIHGHKYSEVAGNNFFDHMWPPNSLDSNSLDYYVWGTVEGST